MLNSLELGLTRGFHRITNFNRDSTFANYARMNNLGAPLTSEYDIGQFRVQGFCGGIVYAPIGQWDNIVHMGW